MVVHAAAISAILFVFGPGKDVPARPLMEKYSVRYLQLQTPEPRPRVISGGSAAGAPAAPGTAAPQAAEVASSPPGEGAASPAHETAKPQLRKFELPRMAQTRQVAQTLVQLERPPDLALRADVRMPAVFLWDPRTANVPRPPTKKFIAPERKQAPKLQQSVLPEPTLDVPNQERNIAEVNLAAVRVTEVPLLPHAPSSTTPVRVINAGPSGEIPRSEAAESSERDSANLISIPDFPLPAGKMLVVPAANQIAAAHMSAGGGQGTGSSESPSGNGAGTGATAGSGHGSELGGGALGAGAGVSPSPSSGTGGGGVSGGPGGRGSGHGTLAGGTGNGPGAGAGRSGSGAD